MVTPVAGSVPLSTPVNQAFPKPLIFAVTANNPVEPVNGGIVRFTVTPAGGASARLSADTATIAGGMVSVTATANSTMGKYVVSATATGADPDGFALTNTEATQPGCHHQPRQDRRHRRSDQSPRGDCLRRQPPRYQHHHLCPLGLRQQASDNPADSRTALHHRPGHHHDRRPGCPAADDWRRRQERGLRSRGWVVEPLRRHRGQRDRGSRRRAAKRGGAGLC